MNYFHILSKPEVENSGFLLDFKYSILYFFSCIDNKGGINVKRTRKSGITQSYLANCQ